MNELAAEIAFARYGLNQRFQAVHDHAEKDDGDLFLSARDAYIRYIRNSLILEKILDEGLLSRLIPNEDLPSEERLDLFFMTNDEIANEIKKEFATICQVHDILTKGLDETLSFAGFSEEKIQQKEDSPNKAADVNKKNGKPFLEPIGNKGYFKENEYSDGVLIGGIDTRKFRLLQTLCEPRFGIHKGPETIFEAIKLKRDEKNQRLNNTSLRRAEILAKIKWTIKEVRKKTKKIKFCSDNNDNVMWIELEG